ncbi:MAG: hypothetical protein JWN43_3050 [Gammaproteobacteria bacterium]|nr:hypothetical protein [Gammaproteobacteria bacterium]
MLEPKTPRTGRRLGRCLRILGIIAVLTWASCGLWNSIKPPPPGTHVSSLPARLAESQVDFVDDRSHRGAILKRELDAIDRAEQLIVLDVCPLARELAQQLLRRKRQRPNLKIMLVTDPRNEVYGGTPAQILSSLEAAGIIVARTRLDRLRDSNPSYSSLWRLGIGWWSDPFDEVPGVSTLLSTLRRRNLKADERQLLVADDGAGGWMSIIMSSAPTGAAAANVALEIRGHLARDIVSSEVQIAAWSTDDDRFPVAPPMVGRGVGTIDARFLTEGAIHTALSDVLGATGNGDSIKVMVPTLDHRQMVTTLLRAAGRGARLQLLLDPGFPGTRAAAGELMHDHAGHIEVRWRTSAVAAGARFAMIQHRNDVWIDLGSANVTRRALDDLNLEADVELHMPARAGPARAAAELFAGEWSNAASYAQYADESKVSYWRYRIADATGLSMF